MMRFRSLRNRFLILAVLSLPVIIMAMVPALQFPWWQWISFALTIPVVGWCAWPFHRAALLNLLHGNATMDTLISIGTLAAAGWSAYALGFGAAGEIGFTHPFEFRLIRHAATANIYLEAAGRHHDLPAARPLSGSAGQAPIGGRVAGPARTDPGRGGCARGTEPRP